MLNHSAVSFSEAVASLYPADAYGEPDLGNPVWLGGCVHGGRIDSALTTRQRQRTGAPHAKPVQGPETHTVELQRLWVVGQSGQNWQPARGRHVLDLTWQDTVSRVWSRTRFYDVAMQAGNWTAEGLYQFGVSQVLTSGRRFDHPGGQGLLPSQSPFVDVFWVAGGEALALYRHDPLTGTYTEFVPGQADSRALIAGDGSSIGPEEGPLWMSAGVGGLSVRATVAAGARPLPYPRLEFRRGDTFLGALAWNGWHAFTVGTLAGPLTAPADGFAFRSAGVVRGHLTAATGMKALGYPVLA